MSSNRTGKDSWRLGFHLMPPTGWLNDPNGLCWYKGIYHFFFQYSPDNPEGGLKVWGHYQSRDLLEWEFAGTALEPEYDFEVNGVYSGSTLVEEDGMHVFYTGSVKKQGDYNYITDGRENNTVYAFSEDGMYFKERICLMKQADYPEEISCHVRDPKVWSEECEGKRNYYMVLGARTKADKGIALIYEAENKTDWQLKQTITTTRTMGYMWECPDIFRLENLTVLSISPQGMEQEEHRYQNIYQSGYFTSTDGIKEEYEADAFIEWDQGFDFYAPQTFLDHKGRRILVGWMGMPDTPQFRNPTIYHGWQHAFTVPRELVVKHGKILQKPVEELQQLRVVCPQITDGVTEMDCYELTVDNPRGHSFRVIIAEELVLNFNPEINICTLGFESEKLGAGRTIRSIEIEVCEKLQIFVDSSCVEVFINDGEYVFTTRFYPKNGRSNINMEGDLIVTGAWKLSKMNMVYK